MTTPRRRILPPVWSLAAFLASYLLDRWLPIAVVLRSPWNGWGVLPILLGALMAVTSALRFRHAGTPVRPFETSTALVTSGWYRITRNPMYLGLALILLGSALMRGSLGALLPVPAFMALIEWRFIRGEEEFLERIFGEDYRRYRERVRRWL